jgi:hypothetical protein
MSLPKDDIAGQALASGITKLPVELKRVILELVVYKNRKLALELVAKSSLCKQWSVYLDSLLYPFHILSISSGSNLLSIAMCYFWSTSQAPDESYHRPSRIPNRRVSLVDHCEHPIGPLRTYSRVISDL